MIRIYGRTSSMNVQKVTWCAAELGVPIERIDAGLEYGKNHEPWFLAMNPNGRIPVLVDGDFSLWESNTIVRYLCAKHDADELYPSSPERRALAERWMDWQLSTLAAPVTIAFQGLIRTPPERRDPTRIATAVTEANAAFLLLEGELARQPYVAGTTFTMADIALGPVAHRWLNLPGIERPPLPAIEAWHERLRSRPAFREHVMLPLR
jgi:glutathione S-transferase